MGAICQYIILQTTSVSYFAMFFFKSVVNFCMSLSEGEFEREREIIIHDVFTEMIQIVESSEALMAYCEIIVKSLVPVPERRIPLIIDLIPEIVVLYKLQINSDNPIEHILAILFERWYPLLHIEEFKTHRSS